MSRKSANLSSLSPVPVICRAVCSAILSSRRRRFEPSPVAAHTRTGTRSRRRSLGYAVRLQERRLTGSRTQTGATCREPVEPCRFEPVTCRAVAAALSRRLSA